MRRNVVRCTARDARGFAVKFYTKEVQAVLPHQAADSMATGRPPLGLQALAQPTAAMLPPLAWKAACSGVVSSYAKSFSPSVSDKRAERLTFSNWH